MLMLTMSRMLSELLGADEPLFTIALQQLERSGGNPSADVRLTAEIIGKVHMKSREMGLDPTDSTGRELYHALMHLTALHDRFLAERIGGRDHENVPEMMPLIVKAVENLNLSRQAWLLKPSAAKRLLHACPPKRVMRLLGYRSIDSMLKREPVAEIYGAIRFCETPQWQHAFLARYKKLRPADFEMRNIELLQLDGRRWSGAALQYVRLKRHNITHLKELGVILMLPVPVERLRGLTITVLPLLLHYINEIRVYSAFFKMQQVRHDFGGIVADTLINDPRHHAVMAGQQIHWRVIHRYFGRLDASDHPEIFEPHLQPEDMYWRKAEEVLYRLEPALHFWHDMDYVGAQAEDGPVSFNLMDMAVNYVNGLGYESRATYHMRDALWNEIYSRYMGQEATRQQVLKQLDNRVLEPDSISLLIKGRV
jgi:hypothetical protein